MFAAAVDDRVLAVSPSHRVRLPRDDRPEVIPPTVEQIVTLAAGVPVRYRALVVLLDGSGPRIGQALGLGVEDMDFLRRAVKVERQPLPSLRIGPPKTSRSARTVPLGRSSSTRWRRTSRLSPATANCSRHRVGSRSV